MRREDSPWWLEGFTREWWRGLNQAQRELFLDELDPIQLESFAKDWRIWARDKQLPPPGAWDTWLLLCGRGFGKTRTGVEYILGLIDSGEARTIALVGQGEADIRTVMIEGRSGFKACSPSWNMPVYFPSVGMGELHWPNGAIAYVYSAEDPESLRGPEFDTAWFDEPMAVPAEKREKTVSNLKFGLRGGDRPRLIYTTTPKPHRWIRDLVAREGKVDRKGRVRVVVTRGSTYENEENLTETFFDTITDDYEGTRLGQQEIYGEILGDEEGALWTDDLLKQQRILCHETEDGEWPTQLLHNFALESDRVVVGVDPNVTADKTAHAAGIIVTARRRENRYVLADRSLRGATPAQWAMQAVKAYIEFDADEIVGEVNQGGDLVKAMVHQAAKELGVDVRFHAVRATKGKQRRAEPVAAAYEQKHVFHMGTMGSRLRPGSFYKLETQMTEIHEGHDTTGEDFDRADALVWALTRLGGKRASRASSTGVGIRTFEDFRA